jgi:hypothetical protein
VLPTGYGKPELSILNFPVRGSGDLIRQLKGHEKMTCKPYLSDPDDMKIVRSLKLLYLGDNCIVF